MRRRNPNQDPPAAARYGVVTPSVASLRCVGRLPPEWVGHFARSAWATSLGLGGPLRRNALLMAFKLLAMVEKRWRRVNGAHLLPLVRAGVQFRNGEQVEREDTTEDTTERAAA